MAGTTAPGASRQPAAAPPLWLGAPVVALVVLLLFAGRAWIAASTDLVADEAYYTLWSWHPSAGYFDHPPLVAWAIDLGRALLGDHSLGVRAVSLLAPLLVSAALWRTARILFDAGVAGLAVLWYNLTLGVALSLLATPDTPSTLFWMLAVWATAEFVRSRNPGWWLVVGTLAGFGVLGKYTNLFLGLGLLAFILASPERRRWLATWQLWAGGALAVLVMLPNLWWNAAHGWATALFQGTRIVAAAPPADVLANYLDLVGGQALFLGPITLLLAVAGMVLWPWQAHTPSAPGLRLATLTGLPALLYFLLHASRAHVEANWLLPLWPMLALLAAWTALRGLAALGLPRPVGRSAAWAQTLLGLVLVGFLQWIVLVHPPQFAHLDRTRDMQGWQEMRADLDRLAAAHGAHWLGVIDSYGLVGLLATYGQFAQSPTPVLPIGDQHRYGFLTPRDPAALAFPGLLVVWPGSASHPIQPAQLFARITDRGAVERRFGTEVIARYQVLEVAAPTAAFSTLAGRYLAGWNPRPR